MIAGLFREVIRLKGREISLTSSTVSKALPVRLMLCEFEGVEYFPWEALNE